jgi:signal transduction histidine kinase
VSTHHSSEVVVGPALAAVSDASRDLIAIVGASGEFRFVNRAGRAALGVRDAPLESAGVLADYLWEDDRPPMAEMLADAAAGRLREGELRFVHRQSRLLVALSCRLLPLPADHAGAALVAIVARPPAAAPDAARAGIDATSVTRLAEMFAAIVGHDLRNPLNAILTSAHVALQQTGEESCAIPLQRIVSSGHRMQRMIDQLLDVTRIRLGSGVPLQVGSVDLHAVAQQVVAEVRAANPNWDIELRVAGDAAGIWDIDRVTQVLSNLVGNAAHHGVREAGIRVDIDGTAPETVTIAVHNQGAIPPELLRMLFSPFRVVHQKRHKSGGLGLGLFVTRQIALAHGGDVSVSSTADDGTRFEVRLPRAPGESPPPHALSGLGEEDMAVLEVLATAPPATSITAQLFGSIALHERVPQEYWKLFERYARLLDVALDRHTYRSEEANISEELRAIAEQLGMLGAGAREVAELHARALKQRTRNATVAKAQALTSEGRLVSFELMGHLLSFYRRRSGLVGGEV